MDIELKNSFVKNVICFEETDSTNTRAKEGDFTENTLFVAKRQTAGRGRMGRCWASQSDGGIYMSLALFPQMPIDRLMQITLVCALAVNDALEECCGIETQIKWPNDILYDGKKLCGILTEGVLEGGIAKKVVTGIGLNAGNKEFPQEIRDIATSVFLITGTVVDKNGLINKIVDRFEFYYKMLIEESRLEKIIEIYKKKCLNIGKKVTLFYENREISGIATDVSPKGELAIRQDDGTVIYVNSGEVTLKKGD